MERERRQKQAAMMTVAKELIDELLEWDEQTGAPTLTQIEEKILKLRKQFGEQMAQVVLAGQEARQPVPGPTCERCQDEMRYKGMKEIGLESWLGSLELERGHYYCRRCQAGVFPPGSTTRAAGEALE